MTQTPVISVTSPQISSQNPGLREVSAKTRKAAEIYALEFGARFRGLRKLLIFQGWPERLEWHTECTLSQVVVSPVCGTD